jgi:uncharacterized protein
VAEIRVLFISDLHGSEVCFRKFINAAKAYKADVIISGGDMTGKMVVPLMQSPEGIFSVDYLGSKLSFKSEDEAAAFEKNVRNTGFYPVRLSQQQFQSMDAAGVEKLFHDEMRKVAESWLQLAEQRLKGSGIQCFMMPGNDDLFDIDDMLEASSYVVNADGKVIDFGPVQMISTGWANITPWHCPRDVSEEELEKRIEAMVVKLRDPRKAIFNLHCPPYDSTLDTAPILDDNLTPQLQVGGDMKVGPVGSKAVRKIIEKYQPALGLHGHIHESRGSTRIGRTLCVNPGSEYQQGILRGAIAVISDKGEVKDWALTAG